MESCSILLRAPHKSAAPAFSWVPTAARAERAWPKRIPDPTSSAPALLQLLRGLSLRELLQKHLQQHRNTSDSSPAHKLSPSSAAFLISPSLPALVFTSKRPPEHCKLFNFQQAALRSGKLKFKALIKAGKKKKDLHLKEEKQDEIQPQEQCQRDGFAVRPARLVGSDGGPPKLRPPIAYIPES